MHPLHFAIARDFNIQTLPFARSRVGKLVNVMSLRKGWELLATRLQEAADAMTHADVRSRLHDAVKAAHPGDWQASYVDHTGDGKTGDCMYETKAGLMSCPYSTESVGGKVATQLDTSKAKPKHAVVTYHDVAADEDNYTSMEAAGLYEKDAGKFIERFISKGERDKMSPEDFAGKGKSFPINSPEDVDAAFHYVGRAGPENHSSDTIRKRIIAIAKRKGAAFVSKLPDTAKEECGASGNMNSTGGAMEGLRDLDLTGDVIPLKEGAVGQDGSAYLKLIAPGWGSSGYYSPDLLERDGPKCFKAGTKSFWNHPTDAEESARPEGDLRDFASVLTEDARYMERGPAGPGLYARAKVNEQFRQPVDDLAKHIGMSIRATGKAKEGKAEGRTGPIIQELTRGISVDYVTTPGAGGQVLQLFEAARGSKSTNSEEDDMDAVEAKALRESNQNLLAEVKKLRERDALREAGSVIKGFFVSEGVLVGDAIEQRVTKRLLERTLPMTTTGELDKDAAKKIWEAELNEEVAFVNQMSGRSIVVGMGTTAKTELTEAQKLEIAENDKEESKEFASMFGFGKQNKAARKIMREGRGAFDIDYNAGDRKVNGVNTLVGMEA